MNIAQSIKKILRKICPKQQIQNKSCPVTEKIGSSLLTYDSQYTPFVRDYYLYCAELLKTCLFEEVSPINMVLGKFPFPASANLSDKNSRQTVRVDIQWEHSLVKPGGRDSSHAIRGKIPTANGKDCYLVRLPNSDHLKTLNVIIDYSIPNIINVQQSDRHGNLADKMRYVAPLVYPMDLVSPDRPLDIITLFIDANQPRRKKLIRHALQASLPLQNISGVYGESLRQTYRKTKILVNIHQTDYHDTFEELRVLPALLCGVVVVCEESPLKEQVPYHDFVVWSSYENMVNTVARVHRQYDDYRRRLIRHPELAKVLSNMQENNLSGLRSAIKKTLE